MVCLKGGIYHGKSESFPTMGNMTFHLHLAVKQVVFYFLDSTNIRMGILSSSIFLLLYPSLNLSHSINPTMVNLKEKKPNNSKSLKLDNMDKTPLQSRRM